MSINNQNPLLSNSGSFFNKPSNNISQQEWEYIQNLRRNGWQDIQQQRQQQNQQQISDPYTDFEIEFSKCSTVVQNKILNDIEFKRTMDYCDRLIQGALESIVRPQVIQTSEGRIAFERMLATFRELRDKYSQEEIQSMEKISRIMQDDVVRKRIEELEKMDSGVK